MAGSPEMPGSASSPPWAHSRQLHPLPVSVASSRARAWPWLPPSRGIQLEASLCAGRRWSLRDRAGGLVRSLEPVFSCAFQTVPSQGFPGASVIRRKQGPHSHRLRGGAGRPLLLATLGPSREGAQDLMGSHLRQAEEGASIGRGAGGGGLPRRGHVVGPPRGCASFFKVEGGSAPLAP